MKKTFRTIASFTMGALLLPVVALSGVSASHAEVSSTSMVGTGGVQGGVRGAVQGGVQGGVQGAHSVYLPGAVGQKYLKNKSAIGAPRAAEVCQGMMCWQEFNGGDIYWSGLTGATMVLNGEIRTRYEALGAQFSGLGLPSGDKRKGLKEDGQWQQYLKGGIFYHPSYGAHAVSGGMWGIWSQHSRENGVLGFPVGDEYNVKGGAAQKFQGGTIYWTNSRSTGYLMLHGEIKNAYEWVGSANSILGMPVGNRVGIAGGYFQPFEMATFLWSESTGAKYISNYTFNVWKTQVGTYGWPTKDMWFDANGTNAQFQKQAVVWKNGVLYSSKTANAKTAVIICDSQCEQWSWGEQGAISAGFTDLVEKGYGGGGFTAPAEATLGNSPTDALYQNRINLPQGNPGLVMLTLGGNDASRGYSDAQILTDMRRMISKARSIYPESPMVINGVMSRNDSDHNRRRQVDALVGAEAKRQGISFVSLSGWGTTYKPGYRDKVHLNQDGHNTIAVPYAKALKQTLGR